MEHEDFPVPGFEFMNDKATDEQKDRIVKLAEKAGKPIDRNGEWPEPFSRWDANGMIEALEQIIKEKRL